MKLLGIDVEKECRKRIHDQEKEIFLPYIFGRSLFPRMLYFPGGSFAVDRYLLPLLCCVCAIHTFPEETDPRLRKISELSLAGKLVIKNQDTILQETGEIIMTEGDSKSRTEETLTRLYPERQLRFLLFYGVRTSTGPTSILLQAAFLKGKKFTIVGRVPNMESVVLKDEKPVLYPLFDEILKKLLFQVSCAHLN